MKYRAYNINYKTDDHDEAVLGLPKEMIVDVPDDVSEDNIPDYVGDHISDETGWLVSEFSLTEVKLSYWEARQKANELTAMDNKPTDNGVMDNY